MKYTKGFLDALFGQPDANADVVRADEAGTLARYVRWLVAESGTEVTDPIAGERRALRYGDVGVLAVITTNLPLLCRAFDAQAALFSSRFHQVTPAP